ncbi:MAG: translation initiation factor IF-2 [Bacteroidetes bacterium]|nr:MAG: translation initiation factor IF-2 [Bacteroidota bacterium]
MASLKTMRLNKAAREFNISTQTIVAFLGKKGFAIDAKPNTKLELDMVELLEKEFQIDKQVKEEAHEKGLDYGNNETVTINDIQNQREASSIDDFQEDIFIQTGTGYAKSKPAPEPEPKPVVEEKPVVEKPTEKEPAAQEPAAEKIQPKAEEPVAAPEKEVEHISKSEPLVEKKVEEIPAPVKEETKKEPTETITPEKTVKEEPVKEETVKEEPVKEEVRKEEVPVTEEKTKETKEGLKVVGSIDLNTLNQKTRPAKKTRAQRKKEAEDKRALETKKHKTTQTKEKPVKNTPPTKNNEPAKKEQPKPAPKQEVKKEAPKQKAKPKEEIEFIKTKYQKINGPTILGKIDLKEEPKPGKKKKKPVASSKDPVHGANKGKRPRKRIATHKPGQQPAHAGKGKSHHDSRKKGPFKRPVKAELTEEQIQKQMKETLARLQGGGKSKASKHRREKRGHIADERANKLAKEEAEKSVLKVTEFLTVSELANMMDIGVTDIIKTCFDLGMVVSINQRLDAETIQFVADEYGHKTEFVDVDNDIMSIEEEEDDPASLIPRPPIVTVMGHVDHGKTKLLDYIRHANVVAGEAGGITQHIGAYEVAMPDKRKITFLDTPGHEAFTAMRARGAKVTDVAIIVIASDDAVMPQTKEAITHVQAAGVPIVFAFNKIDKEGANPEKIKEQLANMNILVEDWGGKFQSQEISAITGEGIEELLEKVLLESEMLDLKANPNRLASGTVLESLLDKGRGYVTNILVQNGTLKKGDIVLAGPVYGKVKALFNERNVAVDEVDPSMPALLLGLNGAPQAGDLFNVIADEKEAKNLATKRHQLIREQSIRTKKHITLDEIGRRLAIGDFKELNIIVKGDVDGSIEALSDELLRLSTEEVQVSIIHKAVGAITETDVMLASASNAIIIGFQVRPVPQARKRAEIEQVDIRLYSIIYQAKEEIESAIKGMLTKKTEEKIVSNLEVRNTFKVTKVGTVAGCYVLDGKINRNTKVRLIRDGIVVYSGNLGSLKRFKDDVKEVATGYECGLNIENFNDVKVGDIIEGYEIVEID